VRDLSRAGRCIMPDRGVFARVLQGGYPCWRFAVITVSIRAHKKEYEISRTVIRDILFAGLEAEVTITVVPDEKGLQAASAKKRRQRLRDHHRRHGLSPRDITPEARGKSATRTSRGPANGCR